MELNLTLALFNGQAQVHARCNSFDELKLVKSFLVEQGLLSVPAIAAANTAIGAQTAAAAAAQQTTGDVGNQQQAAPAEAPKRGRKPSAASAAAVTSTDTTNASTVDAGGAAAGTAQAAPTIQDVTAAITDVANKWDVSEAMALNKRFGVKKAGELKPEQFAEYIAFARDCLANNRKPTEAQLPEGAAADDVSSLV